MQLTRLVLLVIVSARQACTGKRTERGVLCGGHGHLNYHADTGHFPYMRFIFSFIRRSCLFKSPRRILAQTSL